MKDLMVGAVIVLNGYDDAAEATVTWIWNGFTTVEMYINSELNDVFNWVDEPASIAEAIQWAGCKFNMLQRGAEESSE